MTAESLLLLLALLAVPAGADATPAPAPARAAPAAAPDPELAAAAKEGEDIRRTFDAELREAGHDMPKVSAANQKYNDAARAWAKRADGLVHQRPPDPAALDVILVMADIWLVDDGLVAVLRAHHFDSPKVLPLVDRFGQDSPSPRRSFAEAVAAGHPDRAVRGRATLKLARLDRIYLIDGLKPKPSFDGRLGPPDVLRERARAGFERVVREYPDLTSDEDGGAALGGLAKAELAGLDRVGKLEVGAAAPDVEGEDLNGKPLKLTAKSGKVTVLVFWGSWCGPCMRMVPREAALVEKYKDKPFQLVGVNGGDERAKAKAAAEGKHMTWPSFFSGKGRGGLAAAWNVDAWPAVYVIGPDGVIRYKGYDEDGLEAAVAKAVEELGAAGDSPAGR